MPTASTAGVEDGTITEFRDFALLCARAMGACIILRDEPFDVVPTPENVTDSSTYHERSLFHSEERLRWLESLDEGAVEEEAAAWNEAEQHRVQRMNERWKRERLAHASMLEKVRAWNPPTDDHLPFKRFMVEQLEMSMRGLGPISHEHVPPGDWIVRMITEAQNSIDYHRKGIEDQSKRNATRSRWVRDLLESLDG